MKEICLTIPCEKCKNTFYKKVAQFEILEWIPQGKQPQYFHQKFFTCCPICKHAFPIQYSYILRSNEKDFYLTLCYENYKKLRGKVFNTNYTNDFIEKLKILNDCLEPEIIEILKILLAKRYQTSKITYEEYDTESQTIWFLFETNHEKEIKAIHFQSYQSLIHRKDASK